MKSAHPAAGAGVRAAYRSLRLSGIADAARLRVKVRASRLRGRDKPRLSTIVNESRRRRWLLA